MNYAIAINRLEARYLRALLGDNPLLAQALLADLNAMKDRAKREGAALAGKGAVGRNARTAGEVR